MTAWLRQLYLDAGLERVEGEQRPLVWLGDGLCLLWALVREVRRDQLAVRASTLAFWTTVAIVPILLLAFALTGPLGLVDDTRDAALQLLLDTMLADSVAEVSAALDQLLAGVNLQALGIVGVLGILAIGSQLYFHVEQAYNDFFGVRLRRTRLLRFTYYYALLTLGPVFIAGGFVVSGFLDVQAGVSMGSRAIPVLLTSLALVGAIRLLPCTPVSWLASLVGGIVSALLFEIAKLGFTTYTSLLGTHDAMTRIYGSLGLLPVFLLWLYVLWIVVLVGVELAYVVEHRTRLTESQRRRFVDPHVEHRHPDAVFAIAVLQQVLDPYRQERPPPTAPDIADALGADPHGVHTVLEALVDAHLLVEGEGQTFLPARPPDRLTPGVAYRAWRKVTAPVVFSNKAIADISSVEDAVAVALERDGGEAERVGAGSEA